MATSRERRAILTLLLLLFINGTTSRQFIVENKCKYSVGIDTLPSMDLIHFEVQPDQVMIINAEDNWRGFLCLRTHCTTNSSGEFSCLTGNCDTGTEACNGRMPKTPFTSLKVLSLRGKTSIQYGINLQHGFNVPVVAIPNGGHEACHPAGCAGNIFEVCPGDLQVKGPDGTVIGCKSDCDASGDPKACCDGEYGGRDKCQPSALVSLFKKICPSAHTWKYDDWEFSCEGAHTWKYDDWEFSCEGASFDMILCPKTLV